MNPYSKKRDVVDEYPCSWGYTLIATSEERLRSAVEDLLESRHYSLQPSKTSSKGKYKSFHLTLVVESREHRVGLYEALRAHEDIRLVL